jgi:hypothetical protein
MTSTRSELRKFGLTVGGAFAVFALVSWWRGHEIPPRVLGTFALLLLVPGVLTPTVLAPVQRVWMRGATALGYVNTRIILTLLYFVVITPVGFVRRLFGDPLDRGLRNDKPTSWIRREPEPVDPARYERQF